MPTRVNWFKLCMWSIITHTQFWKCASYSQQSKMAGYQEEIPTKKRCLSLSLAERRWQKAAWLVLKTEDKADEAAKGVVPASTAYEWLGTEDFQQLSNPEIVCKWLSWFVLEVYQHLGNPYPPKALIPYFQVSLHFSSQVHLSRYIRLQICHVTQYPWYANK